MTYEAKYKPTMDDLARVVALAAHMGLLIKPPKDEQEVAKRILWACEQLDIRLVDAPPPEDK